MPTEGAGGSSAPRGLVWARVLVAGLVLWVATAAVTELTRNPNLLPTLILVGTFVVPVTFVVYAFGHRSSEALTEHAILVGIVYGGVVGLLAAAALEGELLGQPSLPGFVMIGFIEEACKLGALALVAWRFGGLARGPAVPLGVRDAIILGAAVGCGFAALESSGYALSALFTSGGMSLSSLIQTQVFRGLLAPVGHGIWTGILGGVLFRGAGGRPALSWALLGWYALVSLIHAFWDASQGLAALLTLLLTTSTFQMDLIQRGYPLQTTAAQLHLFNALSWSFTALAAAAGVGLLRRLWRRGHPPVTHDEAGRLQ